MSKESFPTNKTGVEDLNYEVPQPQDPDMEALNVDWEETKSLLELDKEGAKAKAGEILKKLHTAQSDKANGVEEAELINEGEDGAITEVGGSPHRSPPPAKNNPSIRIVADK